MSAGLPRETIERNREIIAARLGWPDGAVDACRELEAEHPSWGVWYDPGRLASPSKPRYRARPLDAAWNRRDLILAAPTPRELSERIRRDEQECT